MSGRVSVLDILESNRQVLDWFTQSSDPKQSILNAVSLQNVKDDDVWITSFPGSGAHLILALVSEALGRPQPSTQVCSPQTPRCVEELSPEELMHQLQSPSPRVCLTHLPVKLIAPSILRSSCRIIHVYRNPKDAYVELYKRLRRLQQNGFDVTWHDFFTFCLKSITESTQGSGIVNWFESTAEWLQLPKQRSNVLNLALEDLIKNPSGALSKISSFLTTSINDGVDFIPSNKRQRREEHLSIDDSRAKPFDLDTIPSDIGLPGEWKTMFTVAQSQIFDDLWQQSNVQFQ
ncbi:sulfotransferase 1C4 [Lingula anatina]|uniref:Sulfotransferase 1C4 n=1 Tax=Lingula anatina TaxID=7574 RepID=A0A1S3J0C4_LINAN|nr:sulfotransferase 1C4 [Lingula anatina]|eukprot:XP_013403895.1 sulfotransferase 1C4 [Lingula anatina]